MKIYKAKKGAFFSNKQAQKYGQRIEQLSTNQAVTPEVLLKDAEDKRSPLHEAFEWNNNDAAFKWRLHKARMLLNSIEVIVKIKDGEEKSYQAYLNLRDGEERNYVAMYRVLEEPDLRKQYLSRAMEEAMAWQMRYNEFKELVDICEEIKKTKVKLRDIVKV